MAIYYLIRGAQIISTIETESGLVCMPILGGGDAMSLLNAEHAQNLMANLGLSPTEALGALGVADLRESQIKTIVIAPNPVSVDDVHGVASYRLLDFVQYSLWQCDGQAEDLVALHNALYETSPVQMLGLLAAVWTFGDTFYPSAVRTATGMSAQQALARRDRIAEYLESLGYTNTDTLRAATDEDAQMSGIVTALGYTEQQLWDAMVT